MNKYTFIVGAILSSLSITTWACITDRIVLEPYMVTGNAFADDKLIYREELNYRPSDTGGTLNVNYFAPDNQIIAVKAAQFNCRLTAPEFTIEDSMDQTKEGTIYESDRIIAWHDNEREPLAIPDGPFIIDAGFDHFVKIHWDELISSKRLQADYLFVRDGKFFSLRFEQSEPPKALQARDNENIVFFKVGADSWLFRMLSSPIYVGYHRDTRTLRYYFGPSNLPSMRRYKNVRIEYQTLSDN